MKRIAVTGLLFLFFSFVMQAQETGKNDFSLPKTKRTKGWVYASFGWHRIKYTNSTIHFYNPSGPVFDFRILKAKADDDHDMRIGKGNEPPQWSVRLGYLFNNKKQTGIELSYDHAKYYLKQGQSLRLKGTINGKAFDTDTVISPDFISYEHTDGANYYMASFVKRKDLSKRREPAFDMLYKLGAGIVYPRTDSRILGFSADKHYHIAGYILGLETTLRYQPFRNLFAELSVKGAFARYGDVLLFGDGRAQQQWFSGQLIFSISCRFPTKSD